MPTLTSTRPSPAAPAQATARSATWWPGALPPPSLVAPHSVAAAGGRAGRVAKSSYSAYYQGDMPSVASLEHVYAGANHVQNYDGTNYGSVWHWAGSSSGAGGSARHSHGAPLNSPNPDTASQKGYNIASMGGKNTPQRRSWTSPSSEGNKRELYGQGRPQAKDSSGNGANWYIGTVSNPAGGGSNVESRFFFEGTVSATDMSRATDAREASRIGIFGTSNSYGGSYGRVTNEALGRDLNPLGRGGGQALVAGMLNVGRLAPSMPKAVLGGGAQGNSVNNPCSARGGCGGSGAPTSDGGGGGMERDPVICGRVKNLPCDRRTTWGSCVKDWWAEKDPKAFATCFLKVDCAWPCPGACTLEEWKRDPVCCTCILCECDAAHNGYLGVCVKQECWPSTCSCPSAGGPPRDHCADLPTDSCMGTFGACSFTQPSPAAFCVACRSGGDAAQPCDGAIRDCVDHCFEDGEMIRDAALIAKVLDLVLAAAGIEVIILTLILAGYTIAEALLIIDCVLCCKGGFDLCKSYASARSCDMGTYSQSWSDRCK